MAGFSRIVLRWLLKHSTSLKAGVQIQSSRDRSSTPSKGGVP